MSITTHSHGRRVDSAAGLAGLEFVNRDLREQLKALQSENADLRVMLAELGVAVPASVGALSLARIRAYESLRYWARCHLREPTAESARSLTTAIVEAERPR